MNHKTRTKEKTNMWVPVWWKTKKKTWGIYTPHIHWVDRGTGTRKDRDEVNRREVCECDGWVCDLEVIVSPSRSKLTRKPTSLTRVLPTSDLSCEENVVLRKWNSPLVDSSSWTDEVVKNRSISRWSCKNKRITNSLCNLPDVLTIVDLKEIESGGILL